MHVLTLKFSEQVFLRLDCFLLQNVLVFGFVENPGKGLLPPLPAALALIILYEPSVLSVDVRSWGVCKYIQFLCGRAPCVKPVRAGIATT